MSDYTIVVFYSEEDGSYIADIPDLKYCSAWGPTPDAAVREVLVAKEAYLESLRAHDDPVPEPRYMPVVYQTGAGPMEGRHVR